MKYLKTYESYYSNQEYLNDIMSRLGKYNITPTDLIKLLDQYENEIIEYNDSGKNPKDFADKMIKDLELDQGGFGTPIIDVNIGRNRSNFNLSFGI